jgi:hypothetical protein
MSKLIPVILVALFSVACAGEPFSADAFSEIPTDAGAAGTTDVAGSFSAGSAGVSPGGSTGAGGSSGSAAGKPAGGAPAGGTSAGGSGGAPVEACEFDAAALTAALPQAFTWKDFSVATGSVCASCAYEPCSKLAVAWGDPLAQGKTVTYKPAYTPNATVEPIVHVAKGDCSGGDMCEVKPENVSVSVSVARKGDGWEVATVAATVTFTDDACTSAFGSPHEMTGALALDVQQEIQASLIGLKIPCN